MATATYSTAGDALKAVKDLSKNIDGAVNIVKTLPTNQLGEVLRQLGVKQLTDILKRLEVGELTDILKRLEVGELTDILKRLEVGELTDILKRLDVNNLKDIFKNIPVDDAADIIKNLPAAEMTKVLTNLPMDKTADVIKALPNSSLKNLSSSQFNGISKNIPANRVGDVSEKMKSVSVEFPELTTRMKNGIEYVAGNEPFYTIFTYGAYVGAAIGGIYLATYVGKDLADEIWNDDEVSVQRRDCLAQCLPRYYDKYLEDEIDLDDLKTPSGSLLTGGKGVQCFPDSCFPSDNRLSVENDGVAPPNRPPMDKYCTPNTINSCQATCKQACEDTYQTTIEDLGDAASSALVGTASSVGDAAGGFLGGIFGGAFDGMEWAFYASVGVSFLAFFLVVYLMFR